MKRRSVHSPGSCLSLAPDLDVPAIRRKVGGTEADFAALIGVPAGTLRNWEGAGMEKTCQHRTGSHRPILPYVIHRTASLRFGPRERSGLAVRDVHQIIATNHTILQAVASLDEVEFGCGQLSAFVVIIMRHRTLLRTECDYSHPFDAGRMACSKPLRCSAGNQARARRPWRRGRIRFLE